MNRCSDASGSPAIATEIPRRNHCCYWTPCTPGVAARCDGWCALDSFGLRSARPRNAKDGGSLRLPPQQSLPWPCVGQPAGWTYDGPTACLIWRCQRPTSGLRRAESVPPEPEAARPYHFRVLLTPIHVERDNELMLALDDCRLQPQGPDIGWPAKPLLVNDPLVTATGGS